MAKTNKSKAKLSPTHVPAPPEIETEATIHATVNVKLNRRRHTNFKLLSVLTGVSMQDYMVQLIDDLLEQNKHVLPAATKPDP